MSFASAWVEDNALFPPLFKQTPDQKTGIIVVIPAFNEPEVTRLLDSLNSCSIPSCTAEVIIIVNAPHNATHADLKGNDDTVKNAGEWKNSNKDCFFRLFILDIGSPEIRKWGVGLCRKAGMDEALRRFDIIDNKNGVIASLDADCIVEPNYFITLENELFFKKERYACSIYFEHPLYGNDFPPEIYWNIANYELHLRIFLQGLIYSGFPYAYHTIGSAMAVKAYAYMKSGGMNRNQAGEDFYFIQKMVTSGGYFSLTATTVYPSPRISNRVPFGTGPAISRMVLDYGKPFLTYNTKAFEELKVLFNAADKLYHCSKKESEIFYTSLPPGVKSFIFKEEWNEKMAEIKNNTSGAGSFSKRFFSWFNMFRIVRYLNHVHTVQYEKKPVIESANRLMDLLKDDFRSDDPAELLIHFRKIEKE